MIKPLNMLNNMYRFVPPGPAAAGPNPYQARIPRLAFGLVGAALTTVTIAVAVILPARLDSGGDEPRLRLASQAIPAADNGAVMSITVVAAREPRPSGSLRKIEAAPGSAPSGETTSSPILRISTAAR